MDLYCRVDGVFIVRFRTAKIARLKSLRLARDAENLQTEPAKPNASRKKKSESKPAGGSP